MSMIVLLMVTMSVSSTFMMLMNMNMIMMMMLIVVGSIFMFLMYYMSGDVSYDNFKLVMLIFLMLMIVMLSGMSVIMFVGWESISVMSMMLIGYWMRPSSKSSAMSAMMYNRWGDLVFLMLMYQIMSELMVLMLMFAVLCKSSLYLWQYWLPVAMESPTPVSSLLHSSTMVVASVYLMMLSNINLNMVLMMILLLSINMMGHFDVKKNIAYSTSIHLLVMLMLSIGEQYSSVVLYIMLHSMIKGQMFQASGYNIHGMGNQDMRQFVMNAYMMMSLLSMMMLSAMVSMVMMSAKELVVLNGMNLVMLIVVMLSFMYTILYMNKLNGVNYVGESEGFYVLFLMLGSMMVVMVGFNFWVSMMVLVCCVVMWMGNPMATIS